MSKTDTPFIEHELSVFRRVRKRLENIHYTDTGYKIEYRTALSDALDKLASSPFASFNPDAHDYYIYVKGERAGSWLNPDIDVFQKHATPSSFGRGEKTVMDPTYRHGTELNAASLSFSSKYKDVLFDIEYELAPAMFVGKEIRLKLYKLAVYGTGGHFDWHRDSTRSDAHHGTVLFALNTEWEGGELMLRRGGVETSIDMHPTRLPGKEGLSPVVVGFYTDTEHKVMPVTKGVRLVLQFDVEVVGIYLPKDIGVCLQSAGNRRKQIASRFKTCPNVDDSDVLIQGVVDEIRELHERGSTVVAFQLAHLYRKASVREEYLKGNDSALFNTLKSHFDVSLSAVVIRFTDGVAGETGDEWGAIAYSYASSAMKDEDSESEDGCANWQGIGRVFKNASFHLPQASAIQEISCQDFIEHVGNESLSGNTKYFGARMFVKPKEEMQ
ncbi:hypothetical protein DEU56DRAFT_841032 [Suillus clintonianus]|uniref:uncharacterized protein n=1 Tax=Suillus clintonianus TaxID=1904413 RepID=UPI001B87C4F9|nr:uncharacterized protein DEU56DRAFT_841032 [Suillus clintonianus]KAG2115494.1 hypothetical protein DEU56DRAFT_841032 [Suillus clintonianus]